MYGPSIGRKLTQAGNGPCKSQAVNGYKENYCSLWARVTVGLYLGWPIMAHENLVGLYLGRPIMAREILWDFSWTSPLWSAKSRGPLAGPAHYGPQSLVGL